MNCLTILLIFVIVFVLWFWCSTNKIEDYWTLPFAGGDVRTFTPDPRRIEGPIGEVLDEVDMDEGDYPI
uniref:Uncharacterized protein n=1 Tax=Marseillevirus LCMAC102 TaxID=2506603 RepID=A0A481YUG6_9VIRU|nr:MAG: hypothetical protein LCMAC102_02100 [Marseillevirus LCMAC102]